MRETIVKLLLKESIKGDLKTPPKKNRYRVSCVFIFYSRFELMENILHCLNNQDMKNNDFEIILVEDKGGTEKGHALIEKFSDLNIAYFAPKSGWGKMGYMRNYGVSKSRGEIILFLDDDTVILNPLFLTNLETFFKSPEKPDALIPFGSVSYSLIKGKYNYHDPYFPSNRCTAYRKSSLYRLSGFDSEFTGQEDVELSIRFIAEKMTAVKTDSLQYYHPPLIYADTNKGYAVGASFAKSRFPILFKILLLINGSRWILLFFIPGLKNKYKARFALDYFKGFVAQLINKTQKIEYL